MSFVQRIRNSGLAIDAAQYGPNFGPIRQCSVPNGSRFYFADENQQLYPGLEEEYRRRIPPRVSALVAEVVEVTELETCELDENRTVICIKCRLPPNVTCEAEDLHRKQMVRLRQVLDGDAAEPGAVTESWFDYAQRIEGWAEVPGQFYVMVRTNKADLARRARALTPGTPIYVCCMMNRIDVEKPERVVQGRCYYLWALDLEAGDNSAFSKKTPGYTCDRVPVGGCEFCSAH
ncbi:hypothetical protein C8R47DRAFT_1104807 [Mycena vitilis]|nr:hypothetical protein C8R47DRAFT_1104807 [Mycena vitilis]